MSFVYTWDNTATLHPGESMSLNQKKCEPQQTRPMSRRRHRPYIQCSAVSYLLTRGLHILLLVPYFVYPFHIPSLSSQVTSHHWRADSFLLAESSSPFKSDVPLDTMSVRKLTYTPTASASLQQQSPSSQITEQNLLSTVQIQQDTQLSSNTTFRQKRNNKNQRSPLENGMDLLTQVRQSEYPYEPSELSTSMETNSTLSNRSNKNFLFWGAFERLFPEPLWDDATILRDLYEVSDRDAKSRRNKDSLVVPSSSSSSSTTARATSSSNVSSKNNSNNNNFMRSISRTFRDSTSNISPFNSTTLSSSTPIMSQASSKENQPKIQKNTIPSIVRTGIQNKDEGNDDSNIKIDRALTRLVEERVYGYRRALNGDYVYETSLMGDGAVKFRDGKRLGNPLQVNIDLLNYNAKREMKHGRLKEAEVFYEKAISLDPKDGRAYLGLSRIAQRRRDFTCARECLRIGIARSVSFREGGTHTMDSSTSSSSSSSSSNKNNPKNILESSPPTIKIPDHGANPFLLQALGTLEEQLGHFTEAETLYIEATKSRPSHAAAWVALGELRSKKLRQGPNAGRVCFQSAERELRIAGLPPSAHVYTAWASLENKAGDIRKARELFQTALDIDPKCSAAWLQLAVLESNKENWTRAKECFEAVLKFDQRNSRVLQAYAIMESKRPNGESREVIELFERALAMNSRDGGVYQAYALYVAKLGDLISARKILRRGTEMDKRHAPLWLAWGVLESRNGSAAVARDIFQQGIWACAQSSGGQSGGRDCARLWQAWGVMEAQENDPESARRCFNRALDADSRNVAAVTAWTLMEQELGNFKDARLIFERALKQFSSPSDEKMSLWRAYEVMETKAGNSNAAQQVYQRSIKDTILRNDFMLREGTSISSSRSHNVPDNDNLSEVEVVTWKSKTESGFGGNEVWMADDGAILGKVPSSTMKKRYK